MIKDNNNFREQRYVKLIIDNNSFREQRYVKVINDNNSFTNFNCQYRLPGRIAQRVERQTEKPGAILTRVRVPGAAWDFCSLSAFSVDFLTVSVQPKCAATCINICTHVNIPNTGSHISLSGHRKILHTQIGMGSAALAAAAAVT